MSKTNLEVMEEIAVKLKELEDKGETMTDKYEALSDIYQLIAQDELPMWDED